MPIGTLNEGPLHAALKRFSDQHPSSVMYDAPRGTVKWKSDLLFPIGSDVVKASSTEALLIVSCMMFVRFDRWLRKPGGIGGS